MTFGGGRIVNGEDQIEKEKAKPGGLPYRAYFLTYLRISYR